MGHESAIDPDMGFCNPPLPTIWGQVDRGKPPRHHQLVLGRARGRLTGPTAQLPVRRGACTCVHLQLRPQAHVPGTSHLGSATYTLLSC